MLLHGRESNILSYLVITKKEDLCVFDSDSNQIFGSIKKTFCTQLLGRKILVYASYVKKGAHASFQKSLLLHNHTEMNLEALSVWVSFLPDSCVWSSTSININRFKIKLSSSSINRAFCCRLSFHIYFWHIN